MYRRQRHQGDHPIVPASALRPCPLHTSSPRPPILQPIGTTSASLPALTPRLSIRRLSSPPFEPFRLRSHAGTPASPEPRSRVHRPVPVLAPIRAIIIVATSPPGLRSIDRLSVQAVGPHQISRSLRLGPRLEHEFTRRVKRVNSSRSVGFVKVVFFSVAIVGLLC